MNSKAVRLLSVWLLLVNAASGFPQVKDGRLKSGAFVSGQGSKLHCGDDTDMDALLKELPDLRNLTHVLMTDAAATDEHLRVLAESCDLTYLRIKGAKATDKGMKFIVKHKNLQG